MHLFHPLAFPYLSQPWSWASRFDKRRKKPPTDPLHPINPDNAWGLCITAPAGTELGTSYSMGTVICSSPLKAVYTPKGVFLHAASLPQTFVHWGIFSTAASRRSPGSISVPVRRVVLSHPLSVIALVSHYLTNKLIDHRPFFRPHTQHTKILNDEFWILNKIRIF